VSAERFDRKVAVILAADVAAYSKHVETTESLTIKAYSEREAILLELIKEFRDRVFNAAGDSVLAEFASAVDAVGCAAAFQVRMME
jgi:adenylate cyclase